MAVQRAQEGMNRPWFGTKNAHQMHAKWNYSQYAIAFFSHPRCGFNRRVNFTRRGMLVWEQSSGAAATFFRPAGIPGRNRIRKCHHVVVYVLDLL